jgi:hypothetical protein
MHAHVDDSRAVWVRGRVTLADSEALGELLLEGAFSAEVYLNGRLIATKGSPGENERSEVPGRLRLIAPLGGAAHPGSNAFAMRLTRHHLIYRPSALVLRAAVVQNSPVSRSVASYLPGFSQVGLLLLLSIAGCAAFIHHRAGAFAWLAISSTSLILAFAFETVPTWWNYAYTAHYYRQLVVWIGIFVFLASLVAVVQRLWRPGPTSLALHGAVVSALIPITLFANGFDTLSAQTAMVLMVVATWTATPAVATRDVHALAFAVLQVIGIGAALTNGPSFVDGGVYLYGASSLSVALSAQLRWSVRDRESIGGAPKLGVRSDIVMAKASGNYADISFKDGTRATVRKTLSELEDAILVRAHRSYLLNVQEIVCVTAKAGSRYFARLKNGADVPVGRKFVASLRGKLRNRLA